MAKRREFMSRMMSNLDGEKDAEIERLQTAGQRVREQTIEECAALAQRWADEAKEFATEGRCQIQANVCRNLAQALRNMARPLCSLCGLEDGACICAHLPTPLRTCATCHAVLADGPQPATTYGQNSSGEIDDFEDWRSSHQGRD